MKRRTFLGAAAALPAAAAAARSSPPIPQEYPHGGRLAGDAPHRIIEPGLRIARVESFTKGPHGIVCVTTKDGKKGYGQVANYEPDITATVLHRLVARHAIGQDPADIDAIVDRTVEANLKFPWSFVCRALSGVDTAIWDLYGRIRERPVYALLGGTRRAIAAYGSSMRRDISPEAEGERLARLRDRHGFKAFKIRVGREAGRDTDAAPGRTEAVIPAVRKAVGPDVALFADANSGYTPPKAIEVGRRLEGEGYLMFEEPCPFWELEWTAKVASALTMKVSGGEQDNDLAQWRRMIAMGAVDVVQPDICYIGGFTRALRVARLAERAQLPVVPHSANLSLVTVFSLHLMAAAANAGPFVEFTIESDAAINKEMAQIASPALEVHEGRVRIPDGPGWGMQISEAWLKGADYLKSEE